MNEQPKEGLEKEKVEVEKPATTQAGEKPAKSTKEPEVSIKDLTKMFETMKKYVDTKTAEIKSELPKKEAVENVVKPDLGETIKDEKPKEENPVLSNIRSGILT